MITTADEIQPLGSRILVREIKVDNKTTAGGLLLPDTMKQEDPWFEVIKTGETTIQSSTTGESIPVTYPVEPGDKVRIAAYGGIPVTVGEEKMLLIQVSDLLAKKLED